MIKYAAKKTKWNVIKNYLVVRTFFITCKDSFLVSIVIVNLNSSRLLLFFMQSSKIFQILGLKKCLQ